MIGLDNVPTILQLGFALLALIWEFDFPPFMVLIIAILNDGKLLFMSLLVDWTIVNAFGCCWYSKDLMWADVGD